MIIPTIATLFLITLMLRGAPFFFGSFLLDKPAVDKIAHYLPCCIMPLLAIYILFDMPCTTLAPIFSITATIALHILFRIPILSIVAGTLVYIALL